MHSAEPFMGRNAMHQCGCGTVEQWHTFGGAVRRSQRPASDGAVYGLRLPATHKSRSQVTDFKNVLRHAMMLRS